MVTLNQKIQLHPEVIDTKLNERELLSFIWEATYYTPNLAGSEVWDRPKGGGD